MLGYTYTGVRGKYPCAMHLGSLGYYLEFSGQNTLKEPDAPMCHKAQRSRIKTVRQGLIFKAARMKTLTGHLALGLGANDRAFAVFELHLGQVGTAQRRTRGKNIAQT